MIDTSATGRVHALFPLAPALAGGGVLVAGARGYGLLDGARMVTVVSDAGFRVAGVAVLGAHRRALLHSDEGDACIVDERLARTARLAIGAVVGCTSGDDGGALAWTAAGALYAIDHLGAHRKLADGDVVLGAPDVGRIGAIGALPVARCQRCALLHGFIRGAGVIAFGTLATSMLLLALVHPPSWFHGLDAVAGGMLLAIGIIIAAGLGFVGRAIAALVVTPRGERRLGDYLGSKAIEILHRDGFYSFRYDSRPDVWELVTKHGAKHRHGGGNAGAALRTLLWIGLVVGYVALRACAH